MSLKDLDIGRLSKLTSEYTDYLKCLECCKYYIAPATAACGHTLCHTCWRGRHSCPLCACSLNRKTLKLNLPLQNLTNHIQTLGEAFENLFKIQLDEFSLDTLGDMASDKDPVKNVKDWLTSSQNHFSAPTQNSGVFSQDSQLQNPLEISANNIIIHTTEKKVETSVEITKIVHVQPPQDDWDKIEAMPDVDNDPKNNENIIGPMDIEPFFVDDTEYTTGKPRRSLRKKDSNRQIHDASKRHNSRDSSCETDKKSYKSKQTWNNVNRMRKEFSKLNKKNRGKLNVSIEMVKKTQNFKPIISPISSQHVVNIDEDTPDYIDEENKMVPRNSNESTSKNQYTSSLEKKTDPIGNKSSLEKRHLPKANNSVSNNNNNSQDKNIKNNNLLNNNLLSGTKKLERASENYSSTREDKRMPFIKKSALCPKNVEVTHNNIPNNVPLQENCSGNSEDIEISIKIGTTITNILIKKKNDVQIKVNTDREVQTSLGPHNLGPNQKDNDGHNISMSKTNNLLTKVNVSNYAIIPATTIVDKTTSDKKNTASADTATVQFEITESVEKELSNVMEYEAEDIQRETSINMNNASKDDTTQRVQENVENVDDLNDLDIFTGSVKEANIRILQKQTPSEILVSTVGTKLKTQRHAEKRNRDNEDGILPKTKKIKVTTQIDKTTPPDSETINYDIIMGQVFARIDADMEDIRKSQDIQSTKATESNEIKSDKLQNNDLSQAQKTQLIEHTNVSYVQMPPVSSRVSRPKLPGCIDEKHSENGDDHLEATRYDKVPQQVEEFLTPVLRQNIDCSQESQKVLQKTNTSYNKSQDFDDSDKSVVEETPQKELSFLKVKRNTTSNVSQSTESQTKKLPSKLSDQSVKSIITLSDTERVSSVSNKDVTVVDPVGRQVTLETPSTISKFADHIIHKSTPVARKSLNFDNEIEDNDPEQTLCPTSNVIAKTTQEKEIMSKAFEDTPTTPAARPLMARNVSKTNKKYCLAASRLTSDEVLRVKILCSQHRWRYVDNYSKGITHLVVSVDEENKSQRSVKYMCALADAKWIVSFAWVERCLQTKHAVDEEYFEALDSFGEPGPRRSRVAKQKLFEGIKFYCMPPFSVLDVVTLKNMLMAAGGHVVQEIKDVRLTKASSQPALLLAEPENTQEDRFIYLAMEHGIVPVNFEWVLNCLGSYSLGSIHELLLCPSSLLPEATASWPEVLIAQDYE